MLVNMFHTLLFFHERTTYIMNIHESIIHINMYDHTDENLDKKREKEKKNEHQSGR